jgi:hypothetical protein
VVERAKHVDPQHLAHEPVGDVQQGGDRLVVVAAALEQNFLRVFHDDDFHFVGVRAVLFLPELHHVGLRERIVLAHRQHVEHVRLVLPSAGLLPAGVAPATVWFEASRASLLRYGS